MTYMTTHTQASNGMKNFFAFSALYLLVAVALVFVVREDPATLLAFVFLKTMDLAMSLGTYAKYLGLFLLAGLYLTRHLGIKQRIVPTIYAVLGCMMFSSAFSLVKTTIPHVMPFWADEMFADLDALLHFGTDPWVWTHGLSGYIPASAVVILYFFIWTLPAIFLPVILAITDTDQGRINRYLVLHVFCWIGLGNVLATCFASVGPIYYDRLLGGERFAGLIDALETSGITGSKLGVVQQGLWTQYIENGQSIGSGISAFPSVHNGVAMVFTLYLIERSKLLTPLALIFMAAICFASVYNGWHYAVDGYASMILISVVWALQRRRNVAFAQVAPA